MDNNIQLFNYGESPVRTIEKDGQIWFVAKDVCDILGFTNSRDAIANHVDDDEKNTVAIGDTIHRGRGNPNVNVISEFGVYTLILRSNTEKAKKFRRWVTHEVLPQIMRTGKYSRDDDPEQENLPVVVGEPKEEKQLQKKAPSIHSGNIKAAKEIFTAAGLTGKKLARALDDVFMHYTGESAIGIALVGLEEFSCNEFAIGYENGEKGVYHITAKDEFGQPVVQKFIPMDIFRVMYDDCWPTGGAFPKD